MIIGVNGPAAVISAETAFMLERFCKVTELRVRTRGLNPRVAQELLDLRQVAMQYVVPPVAEAEADPAEVASESRQWLSPVQVADLLGLTDRAVRLACSQGRIEGCEQVGGRWRISREGAEHYRAARAA